MVAVASRGPNPDIEFANQVVRGRVTLTSCRTAAVGAGFRSSLSYMLQRELGSTCTMFPAAVITTGPSVLELKLGVTARSSKGVVCVHICRGSAHLHFTQLQNFVETVRTSTRASFSIDSQGPVYINSYVSYLVLRCLPCSKPDTSSLKPRGPSTHLEL